MSMVLIQEEIPEYTSKNEVNDAKSGVSLLIETVELFAHSGRFHPIQTFFWNGSQLPVLCRDVEYLSYHRMVSLAVNMPISYFSFCQ